MSKSGVEEVHEEAETEQCSSLYVFPNQPAPSVVSATAGSSHQVQVKQEPQSARSADVHHIAGASIQGPPWESVETPISMMITNYRTHVRSSSHGGVLASLGTTTATRNSNWMGPPPAAPRSALKKPGHQRAFSQGQVVDVQKQGLPVTGQSRVGSKTDFILPPDHRPDDAPRPSPAGKVPSFRGHSRQASRSESIYTIRRGAAPPWWRRLWARYFGSPPEEPPFRTIVPSHLPSAKVHQNQQYHNQKVVDNRIRTTKYSALSFLPRNLLEQFHRVANLYFIFIVLLNWVPAINAFGKEIAMIPVLFVLGVTALKDFFEDRRRLASDKRVNNSTCRVYTREHDRYVKVFWKDIKVGDIVHLSNNEVVPADLLLLRSSDPQGFAYLDTCNLDGETNLKQRQVVRGFLDLQDSFQPSKFRSRIEIDKPSTKIYRFHGAVVHPNGARVPVSTENLLLRECLLKNTDFVEGIVIYVGHETKAMLNSGGPRYKRSRLEHQMNLDVVWCVVILVVLCIVGAAGCRFWLSAYTSVGPVLFLPVIQDPSYEGMLTFWTFVIILQVMIPLSLYVTIEMAKLGQVYHIIADRELYDEESDRTAECRALNITEELGQIQYVFSDKTGTLTENKMIFRRCAVGGLDYGHTGEGENLIACKRLKEDLLIGTFRHRLQEFLILLAICNTVVVNSQPHHDSMNSSGIIEEEPQSNNETPRYPRMKDTLNLHETLPISVSASPTPILAHPEEIISPMSAIDETSANSFTILRTKISRPRLLNLPGMTSLSVFARRLSPLGFRNHSSLLVEKVDRSALEILPTAIYEAESPDELALVHAAKAYNVQLVRRTPKNVIVLLPDKSTLTFEILKILPFDSNRRCMSIVVRHPYTGEIVLYSKGADTTILSALNPSEEESAITNKIRQHLHSYARQGLRTLVMARRSLSPLEYETWREKHAEVEATSTGDQSKERRLRESYSMLESQMSLLGATGIEDKLQAGVPEAMASLVSAGIVVWVLTGDKPETAVNVAYSACLFSPSMQLIRLQARSKTVAENMIQTHLEAIKRENSEVRQPEDLDGLDRFAYEIGGPWQRKRAIVVDGKTLTFILDPRSGLTGPFLELTRVCSSVLACRTTPLQKAYIVKVVKERLRMRTLAIGDGANDVSMIQTADVGIGISGLEGTQAVMAADFAIATFPMLTRLLLVHGHWCYDRLSRMILYFFYKNATFVFLIFWYQLYCGFSGTVMIDQVYLMLYNLVFTSLPPLVLGIYDQIVPANILQENPKLYERGRLASVYKPHSFWITMADALYQSIIIFFLTEAIYHDTEVDIWEFGTTITSSCIVIMLIYICIEMRSWTLIHAAAIVLSLGAFFVFALFYNAVCVNCLGLPGSFWVMEKAIGRHIYYLTVILSTVLAILPRIVYRSIKNTVSPDSIQRVSSAYAEKNKDLSKGRDVGRERSGLVAGWSRSTQNATIRPERYRMKDNALTTIVA